MNNNNISGIIPNLKLPLLEVLNLSDNNFNSSLPDFRYLWNVKTIDIQNSSINGELPFFTNCTELEYLYLQDNELTGELHDFLMPDLLTLDISDNQITGNILDFSYLPKLEILALENNELEGFIPSFTYLNELTSLFLQNNNLEGSIPDLSTKESLGYVDLRYNKFTFEDILPNLAQNESSISTFHYAPQQEVGEEIFVDIASNGSYSLCVDIDHDVTTSTYEWFKDGVSIGTTSVNEYLLENLDISDAGIYHCEITNPGAPNLELISATATIEIISEAAPELIEDISYNGESGERVRGTCISNDGEDYLVCGRCANPDSNFSGDYCIRKFSSDGVLEWTKMHGGTSGETANDIIKTNNNDGYIVIGVSTSDDIDVGGNYGQGDLWLIKIDEDGELIWEHNYGGSMGDGGLSIVSTNQNNGYVILGYTVSSDVNILGHHGKRDYWCIKVDNDGELIWSGVYGGSDDDYAYEVIQSNEGDGYIISGYTNSEDGDISNSLPSAADHLWYLKINEFSNIVWDKSYGNVGYDMYAPHITEGLDGGYVISMSEWVGTSKTNVLKTDDNGVEEWFREYLVEDRRTEPTSIVLSYENNGYVIGGRQKPYQGSQYEMRVFKIDVFGNLLWDREYPDGANHASVNSMIRSVTGDSYIISGDFVVDNDQDKPVCWIIQLDGDPPLPIELSSFTGEALKDKNLLRWQTLSEENVDTYIIERSLDGREWKTIGEVNAIGNSSILRSYSFSDIAPLKKGYYRLKVFDDDESTSYSRVLFLEREPDVSFAITQIFPNPTSENIFVHYTSTTRGELTYSVLNMYGEELLSGERTVSANEEHMEFSLQNIPSGLYVLVLQSGEEQTQQKFIKY